jgi:tetratricopeptide (TPR) repeat protein
VHDRETHREIREKVTGKLLTLDRTLEPILPALLALLDVPVEDTRWQTLDPPQRRRQTLDAVKGLLLRESQMQPLLVIFEDLHWIDSETQALLDSLVESLPTARLLLLVNYRPEYRHAWGSKTYYTQLRLDTLPPESANELLLALLGIDATVEPLKPVLIARTGGNPLFLEESVRTLVETHALTGERGAHRLARPLDTIDVPATVQAILASRIDRLDPQDKQLLQTASVIGKDVPFALLLAIAELPEDALRRGLAHLQSAEFLYETSLFPDLEYTFKHALTHEVAYGSVLQERRRVLHAQTVEAIETRYPERLAEQAERLAHHAVRGEIWGKAFVYLCQAGRKAFRRSAHREAVASFEGALQALRQLPETPETLGQAIDVRFDLRHSLIQLGRRAQVTEYMREAERISETLGDLRRLGRALAFTTNSLWAMGSYTEAERVGRRALEIAKERGDFGLEVMARHQLGHIHHSKGAYGEAIDLLTWNVDALKGELAKEYFDLAVPPAVISRTWLIWCLAERGEFTEGTRRSEEVTQLAEASGRALDCVYAYRGTGYLHLRKGDFGKAIEVLERGHSLCGEYGFRGLVPQIAAALSLAYALCGRIRDALALQEDAVELAAATGMNANQSLRLALSGEVYLLAEQRAAAASWAMKALEMAERSGERGDAAWALRLLGEIEVLDGPSAAGKAEAFYRGSLALAAELEMRPLVAHCHLGLGKLSRRTGKREQAREHLTTATTMYREMDMRFWLEKTGTELQALD